MTEKNKTQEIITEASLQGLTVKQRVQIGNRRRVKRRRNFVLPLVCFAVLFALMFCIGSIESNSAASAKSPEGTPNSGLQLTFLGDIMMGRYIGQGLRQALQRHFRHLEQLRPCFCKLWKPCPHGRHKRLSKTA